ncbi:MAG TPA: MFS transporter [Mycobacteriales bacterium]|nr:MFS transporter [Mycobacteriales bacterium]
MSRTSRLVAGFWVVAVAFATMMAFTTVPTPLYGLYEERDGFATWMVTVIFSIYAVGVMLSLYLAGHVSDWLGRRRLVVVSAGLLAAAAVLFLLLPQTGGLLAARFVSGLGIGTLTATATAFLADLRQAADRSAGLATTIAGVANLGGLSLGPLVGGVLAEWAPRPLVLPFAVFLGVIVAGGAAVLLVPETVTPPRHKVAWHPQRITVPASERSAYWAAGIAAFASFAITGFFGSVAPTFLRTSVGTADVLVAGVTSFSVFAAAAVAQVLFAGWPMRRQLLVGVGAVVVGMAVFAVGDLLPQLALFLVGGIVSGAGVGLVFRGSLATAGGLADEPSQRGQVLAGIFVIAYAGLTIPVVIVGVVSTWVSLTAVSVTFAALIAVLVAAAAPVMLRNIADGRAAEAS